MGRSNIRWEDINIRHFYDTINKRRPDIRELRSSVYKLVSDDPYFCAPHVFLYRMEFDRNEQGSAHSILRAGTQKAEKVLKDFLLNKRADTFPRSAPLKFKSAIDCLELGLEEGVMENTVSNKLLLSVSKKYARTIHPFFLKNRFENANNNLKFMGSYDISKIEEEVFRNAHYWVYDTVRQTHQKCVAQTQVIDLCLYRPIDRSRKNSPCFLSNTRRSVYFPNTMFLARSIEKDLGRPLARIALTKLRPKGRVGGHYDYLWWYPHLDRYHLPIGTKRNTSVMMSGREIRTLNSGEMYYFDNLRYHGAINMSEEWRLHLFVDVLKI